MCTKTKHQSIGKKAGKNKATFRHLPKKTKKLMMLKEQEEQSTGSKQVETAHEIDERA